MDSNAVANYLLTHPQFFEEHAELLSQVRLSSALGVRTVSLQERQMDIMREKFKAMEQRLVELIRIGRENDSITKKLQHWTSELLYKRNDIELPNTLTVGLQDIFNVPHVTLRMWHVAPKFAHAWFATPVSEDVRLFASGMTMPYCGANNNFEAANWFESAPGIASIALLALSCNRTKKVFGLLVLGSPDAERFTPDMATDFLDGIGKTASAALSNLLD